MTDDLHHRIRQARTKARLNQAELATRLRISPSAVAQWEAVDATKRTTPRRPRIRQIAAATGVSPVWLETGVDAPAPDATELPRLSPDAVEHLDDLFAEVHDLSPTARRLVDAVVRANHHDRLSPDRAEAILVLLTK